MISLNDGKYTLKVSTKRNLGFRNLNDTTTCGDLIESMGHTANLVQCKREIPFHPSAIFKITSKLQTGIKMPDCQLKNLSPARIFMGRYRKNFFLDWILTKMPISHRWRSKSIWIVEDANPNVEIRQDLVKAHYNRALQFQTTRIYAN